MIAKHTRQSPEADKALSALGDIVKFFKLPPRQFEPSHRARSVLERIRREERYIMLLCVREAKMPRKHLLRVSW